MKNSYNFLWLLCMVAAGFASCHHTSETASSNEEQAVFSIKSSANNDLAIVWDGGAPYQNQVNQRIGLQMRDPSGLLLGTRYLTPDSVNADFPVIRILNNKDALVAYTQTKGEKQQVKYQVISL